MSNGKYASNNTRVSQGKQIRSKNNVEAFRLLYEQRKCLQAPHVCRVLTKGHCVASLGELCEKSAISSNEFMTRIVERHVTRVDKTCLRLFRKGQSTNCDLSYTCFLEGSTVPCNLAVSGTPSPFFDFSGSFPISVECFVSVLLKPDCFPDIEPATGPLPDAPLKTVREAVGSGYETLPGHQDRPLCFLQDSLRLDSQCASSRRLWRQACG